VWQAASETVQPDCSAGSPPFGAWKALQQEREMSTLGIIDTHVTNALKATTADEKLDEIARAVGELGRFFSNMEDRLRTEIHDVNGNQRSQDR
jgi:hypothetical protein